jgi:Tol biopolymer transport system component
MVTDEHLPGPGGPSENLAEPEQGGSRRDGTPRMRITAVKIAAVAVLGALVLVSVVFKDGDGERDVRVASDQVGTGVVGPGLGVPSAPSSTSTTAGAAAEDTEPTTTTETSRPASTTTTATRATTTTAKPGVGPPSTTTTSSTTTSSTAPVPQPPSILGKIVFSSTRAWYGNTPDFEIWVMNPDGTQPRQLTKLWYPDREPDLSPDGRHIVWIHTHEHGSTLMIMGSDGSNQRQLAPSAGTYGTPKWAPDGERILYNGEGGLYTIKPDGTEKQLVFSGYVWHADWAPDGRRIVVEPGVGAPSEDGLWIVDLRNQSKTHLFKRMAEHPSWSPSGDRIVFSARPDHSIPEEAGLSDRTIYSIGPDGTGLTRLSALPSDGMNDTWADHTTWSRDGRQIYFTLSQGDGRIWVMNADGSNPRQLVDAGAREGEATL